MFTYFSNSILLHFLYLQSQSNGHPKCHPYKLRTLEVTVLQSGTNRKIDLYSDNVENKMQSLSKTAITYERSLEMQPTLHEQANSLLSKLCLQPGCLLHNLYYFIPLCLMHSTVNKYRLVRTCGILAENLCTVKHKTLLNKETTKASTIRTGVLGLALVLSLKKGNLFTEKLLVLK